MEEKKVNLGSVSATLGDANAMSGSAGADSRVNTPNKINPMIATPVRPDGTTSPITPMIATPSTEMPQGLPMAATLQNMPPDVPTMAKMPDKTKPGTRPAEYASGNCDYKHGQLPSCAPLAAGYVPFQQKNAMKYSSGDALTHGTLFPGLDLPFMNVANKNNPYANTPLGELMAIDFAIHELKLYLDTHKEDTEAFEMMKSLMTLGSEGGKKYIKQYGPVSVGDMEKASGYTWLNDPWPWEYTERAGK